ncbi:MAG TPA: serine/threonine-protein kinase [Polyangiaceae bacterium]
METSGSSGDDAYSGLVLDGQFRLEQPLGNGSMARVYRARHLSIDRDVAVKILRHELLEQSDVVARFKREAQIAAKLAHPNVIVVHAVGEIPNVHTGIGGEPYVTLELLGGPSLAKVLGDCGETLPLARALHIVLSVCDALGEAHAQGIVHRDVKPENVMLVRRGGDDDFVKVLDFGLAKTLDDPGSWHTRAGAVLGTPRYLSPEGAEGRAVTPAADCYAIATLLYRCLAGRTPFDGPNAVGILVQQSSAEPPDIRGWPASREVPEPIARVIMQNLAKRPESRAVDARALGRALVDAARAAGLDGEQIGLSSTLLGSTRRWSGGEALRRHVDSNGSTRDPSTTSPERRGVPANGSRLPSARAKREITRRLALFVACFMLGAAAAAGVASRMGALSGSLE